LADAVPARLTSVEGRKFGLTVGVAFLVVAMLVLWRGHPAVATGLGLLGASLSVAALTIPQRLGPVQRGWMAMATAISKVTTPIVMGVVYFLVLTPTGLLRRALGWNPLAPTSTSTLWSARGSHNRSDLTRQF
jgi:Saxitoxin biosynthesis operon protein SxtJ